LSAIRLNKTNSSADDDGMTNLLRLRAARRPAFVVEELTTHRRILGGRIYRDAVVVLPGGERRLYALPEVAA